MSGLRRFFARLPGLVSTRRRDRDLEAEFDSHLQMQIDELTRAGVPHDEARRQALVRTGGLEMAKEAYRDQRSLPIFERALQTLRHAATGLRRRPGYPLAVVISLGLGVGANTAMFTLVDGVLRRPLPYADAEGILTVGVTRAGSTGWEIFPPDLDAWKASQSLEAPATFNWYPAVVSGDGPSEYVDGAFASPGLLRVLGIDPGMGRWFTLEDAQQNTRVVVISHDLWQRQFGGRADVIGRTLKIYGEARPIVGVMRKGMGLPLHTQFWLLSRGTGRLIARTRPGVTREAVASELTALSPSVANLRRAGRDASIVVTSLQDQLYGSAAPALRLLFGATLLLLLIACANIANLSLARALDRRREWAMRATLGASRRSLAALVVAENLILAVMGGLLGGVAASWTSGVFVALAPSEITLPDHVGLSWTSMIFAAALVLIAAFAVSVGPALAVTRGDFQRPLSGSGIRPGRASLIVRRTLVTAQLATALLLMTGTALLVRSTARVSRNDLGFDPRGVVTASVSLVGAAYRDEARVRRLVDDLSTRVSALPGVQSMTFGPVPLVAGRGEGLREGFSMVYTGPAATDGTVRPTIWVKYVDARYFETFRIPLRAGRGLLPSDDASAPAVALLNARAARLFFPAGDEIGQILGGAPTRLSGGRPITVVGVTQDVRQRDVALDAEPEVFVPMAQQSMTMSAATIAIRTSTDPAPLMAALRQVLREIDPDLATSRLTTMTAIVDASLARYRFLLLLLGAFASLSVVLATFGLYAVVAYLTTQRTREIGVRMALGAQRHHVLGLLAREVAMLVAGGVAIGLIAAFSLSGMLASFLYEISPNDATAFASAPLLLAAVTFAAAYGPARRASRIDPARTLRAD